jgi:hypothetical protein
VHKTEEPWHNSCWGSLSLTLKAIALHLIKITLGLLSLLLLQQVSFAQSDPELADDDVVAMVKAAYLFKFATANDWPEQAKKGAFKVGIIGSESVYNELLAKYATKPVGSQVLEVSFIEEDKVDGFYHLLYVADGTPTGTWRKLQSKLKDQSTLIVGDKRASIERGACIAFVTVDNGTKYIISPESAQKRGISIGSTIILWAVGD